MKNKLVLTITSILLFNSFNLNSFAENKRKTLAISEFSNNTGSSNFDNLEKGLADSLTNSLAKYSSFSILERAKLKEALKELSLSQSGLVSSDTVVKIGKLVGSKYIIFGSILKAGQLYQVSLRVVETESGKVILGELINCSTEESIINSVNYLALKTANSLGEEIDLKKLEEAKNSIQTEIPKEKDFTLLYLIGGVVAVGGIVAAVIAGNNFWNGK